MEQTSIISPWIFYAIDLLAKFQGMLMILVALSFVVSLYCILDYWFINDSYLVDKNNPRYKPLKISIIVLLISLILLVLIPTESTVYKMLIANEITDERMDDVIKIIDNKTDEIIEALK